MEDNIANKLWAKLTGGVMGLLPSWLMPVWGYILKAVEYISITVSSIWMFPFLASTWYMALARTPLWVMWLFLMTQPAQVNEIVDKVTDALEKIANRIWATIWPLSGVGISLMKVGLFVLLCYSDGFRVIPMFAFFFKTWEMKGKKWKVGRLALVCGIINFLSSERVVTATIGKLAKVKVADRNWFYDLPVGWLLSYGIAITLIVVWTTHLQSAEQRKQSAMIYRRYGKIKGFLVLVFVKPLVPSVGTKSETTWTCDFCGYKKNEILEKSGPTHHCDRCHARNPDIAWPCECKAENPGNRKSCVKCGRPSPFRDSKGNPLPCYPDWVAKTTPTTPVNPPANQADSGIDMVDCPHCYMNVPKTPFCTSCAQPLDANKKRRIARRDMS